TIATTCYGMNDHGYRASEPQIGERYKASSTAIVEAFKHAGARVVLGSPGCVGKVPTWTKSGDATLDSLNLNLLELRNIDIDIALRSEEHTSELQSRGHLVCRLLLEKKKKKKIQHIQQQKTHNHII